MTYETIFSRRFSKHDQKKMGSGAIICFFLMAFTLCRVFKPYIGPLPPSKCMHYSFLNFSCFISLVSISCASCMNTKTDARHLQLFRVSCMHKLNKQLLHDAQYFENVTPYVENQGRGRGRGQGQGRWLVFIHGSGRRAGRVSRSQPQPVSIYVYIYVCLYFNHYSNFYVCI